VRQGTPETGQRRIREAVEMSEEEKKEPKHIGWKVTIEEVWTGDEVWRRQDKLVYEQTVTTLEVWNVIRAANGKRRD